MLLTLILAAAAPPPAARFARDVEPILTKAGCNAGGCHGAQHGKGGFRLSLFGFDPVFDYEQIVRSAEGRRVVLADPDRSILLSKPSLAMEHGGGLRLKPSSKEYAAVRDWLADGAAEPTAADPTVAKLTITPAAGVMAAGETRQLRVVAAWTDGVEQDVTPLAQFDSLNDAVAAVTPTGRVTAKAAGETHIMVRYLGQAGVSQVTRPFGPARPFDFKPNNFIDAKLAAKWSQLGLAPSPVCDDDDFLRRLLLDAAGVTPTPAEVTAFLADASPDKRERAIVAALDRPEFIDWWTLKWDDLLRVNRTALEEKGMWSFHNWVRAQVRDNVPADKFAAAVITAEGSTFTDGPANFFRVGRTAEDWAENVAQVFLGVRVQCAKCHHHPFEAWGQDDYYGMTAYFARLGTKTSQEFGLFGRESVVFAKPAGEVSHPRTRKVVKPKALDGPAGDDPIDRRVKLAAWVAEKGNPYFARNVVNRFWGYLMGRGLVEPLDDQRATNPASNPELLDALAKDFEAHDFDVKHLLATIFRSRAYHLSSQKAPGNEADASNTHFARYSTKRLTAEQTADAIDAATGTREKYPGLPLGTRAAQLPDPGVRSYLLDTFGRPARQVACECERTTKPNVAQAMHMLNGDFLQRKIADPNGRVEKLVKGNVPTATAIAELYLAALGRPPTADEAAKAKGWVTTAASVRVGLQDLLWVLLNSREFLFNR